MIPHADVMAANVVATSHPLAAQAGLRMLQAGGNAVDAALAAAITLTVVEPTGNGLGSDAFALVWDGAELAGLNASGRAPQAWTPERFAGRDRMPDRGWDSVTVPGAVSAWVALSERFGRLDFAQLFAPAIHYARLGFAVTPTVAGLWQKGAKTLADQPGFAQAFMPVPSAGDWVTNPDLARSLEKIAASRGQDFYQGDLARSMAADAAKHGGGLCFDDLARHRADWVSPIHMDTGGYRVHELPPNGQGIAALMALGILDRLGIGSLDPDSAQSMHVQIEAMKLAFADVYRHVADPASMSVTTQDLLDPAYLDRRASLVDLTRALDPSHGLPEPGGTVYITAADSNGMMVSLIQSNYFGFGSGVVVPGTGISMQSRGLSFSTDPAHPNAVASGKRPFHTIIPSFVTKDGQPVMSFGVMGASMQAQGHVQMVNRILLGGQSPQAACDAPRWRVLDGTKLAVEAHMPKSVLDALTRLGHQIQVEQDGPGQAFGGAQIILKSGSFYRAASDNRKDGVAAGF